MIISERLMQRAINALVRARLMQEKTEQHISYEQAFKQAEEERQSLGRIEGNRGMVECRDCSHTCKVAHKEPIMWPARHEGEACLLCGRGKLVRASIL